MRGSEMEADGNVPVTVTKIFERLGISDSDVTGCNWEGFFMVSSIALKSFLSLMLLHLVIPMFSVPINLLKGQLTPKSKKHILLNCFGVSSLVLEISVVEICAFSQIQWD